MKISNLLSIAMLAGVMTCVTGCFTHEHVHHDAFSYDRNSTSFGGFFNRVGHEDGSSRHFTAPPPETQYQPQYQPVPQVPPQPAPPQGQWQWVPSPSVQQAPPAKVSPSGYYVPSGSYQQQGAVVGGVALGYQYVAPAPTYQSLTVPVVYNNDQLAYASSSSEVVVEPEHEFNWRAHVTFFGDSCCGNNYYPSTCYPRPYYPVNPPRPPQQAWCDRPIVNVYQIPSSGMRVSSGGGHYR
jgi:hypothetical protein